MKHLAYIIENVLENICEWASRKLVLSCALEGIIYFLQENREFDIKIEFFIEKEQMLELEQMEFLLDKDDQEMHLEELLKKSRDSKTMLILELM